MVVKIVIVKILMVKTAAKIAMVKKTSPVAVVVVAKTATFVLIIKVVSIATKLVTLVGMCAKRSNHEPGDPGDHGCTETKQPYEVLTEK